MRDSSGRSIESRFQRLFTLAQGPGAMPQARIDMAPLALKTSAATERRYNHPLSFRAKSRNLSC